MPTDQNRASRQVWVSLPVDTDSGERAPTLYEYDHYVVRLDDGSVRWAEWYTGMGGSRYFVPSDGETRESEDGLSGVRAVLVSGYGPGVSEALGAT